MVHTSPQNEPVIETTRVKKKKKGCSVVVNSRCETLQMPRGFVCVIEIVLLMKVLLLTQKLVCTHMKHTSILRVAGKTVSDVRGMQISGNFMMAEATIPLRPTSSG